MKEEDKNEPIGSYLKKKREHLGFSLQDISSKTKINLNYLEYLEKEEFFALPNEVFIKGFLRSYAKVLGVEESDILDRFQQWKSLHQVNLAPETDEKEEKEDEKTWRKIKLGKIKSLYDHQKSAHRKMIGNVLIGILIAVGVLVLILKKNAEEGLFKEINSLAVLNTPGHETSPAVSAPATAPSSAEGSIASAGNPPSEAKEKTAPKEPNLHLTVQAIDRSWISVVIDDGVTKEFSLRPEDKISLAADKKFLLNIGNAGGVRISLNGKPVGPFGKKGEVVRGIRLE